MHKDQITKKMILLGEEEGGSWECFGVMIPQCWLYLFAISFLKEIMQGV